MTTPRVQGRTQEEGPMNITNPFCVLPLIMLLGCNTLNPKAVAHPPNKKPWSALAVAPLLLISGDDGFNTYKRTYDIIRTLWNESEWAVIEPAEFTLRDQRDRNFLQSTDLVIRAKDWGLDPRTLVLLQGAVSVREAKSHGQSSVGTSASYQGEASVSLQMYTMEGIKVAQADVVVPLNPFAPHPDYDKRPEIAEAIVACTLSILDACKKCVRRVTRPSLPLFPNPVPLLQSFGPDGTPLRTVLDRVDPITREQMLLQHFQYFLPDVSLKEIQFLGDAPEGVCLAADAPPLDRYDCIRTVNETPVNSPHALSRALDGKDTVNLRVIGANKLERKVLFPIPTH